MYPHEAFLRKFGFDLFQAGVGNVITVRGFDQNEVALGFDDFNILNINFNEPFLTLNVKLLIFSVFSAFFLVNFPEFFPSALTLKPFEQQFKIVLSGLV